ncbi:MAG TPA: hypothetical protein VK536_00645 [Candidatus Limnocylindrales bacterium]|nr:hypothetical protein [Candidatus Limnocylindrales bacterium]
MRAKLQKQLAYKYKEKKHYKHVIVVPDDVISELGWRGGQELELAVKEGKLIIGINGVSAL